MTKIYIRKEHKTIEAVEGIVVEDMRQKIKLMDLDTNRSNFFLNAYIGSEWLKEDIQEYADDNDILIIN